MPCAACSGPLASDSWSLSVCSDACLDAFVEDGFAVPTRRRMEAPLDAWVPMGAVPSAEGLAAA